MENFLSKIEVRFKDKKIMSFQKLNFLNFERKNYNYTKSLDDFFLLPGMEIWQILLYFDDEAGEILQKKEIKLTTILKQKKYEKKINNKKIL